MAVYIVAYKDKYKDEIGYKPFFADSVEEARRHARISKLRLGDLTEEISIKKAQPKDHKEARKIYDATITQKCIKCGIPATKENIYEAKYGDQ